MKDLTIAGYGATANYVIDVQGYFIQPPSIPSGAVGSVYVPLAPCRVLDTRPGVPLAAGASRSVQVGGTGAGFAAQGGKPGGCSVPTAASAVEASVSAVGPSGNGYFRAWPRGTSPPNATFLNFTKAQSITNAGAVPLAATGVQELTIASYSAPSDYVIDVLGYFIDPMALPAGVKGNLYVPVTPCRVLDTRPASPLAASATRVVQVGGTGEGFAAQGGKSGGCEIPEDASAVEASVSAVGPAGAGFLRVWPNGIAPPTATFLNFTKAQSITNAGAVPLAATGKQDLAMAGFGARSHYVIDVLGFFTLFDDPGTPADDGTPQPPDAGMAALLAEPILQMAPPGVVAGEPVEAPADGEIVLSNKVYRDYVAQDDGALVTAAEALYQAALDDGWDGPPFDDPGQNGLYGTTLTKGDLTLDLSYSTSVSFDLLPDDHDQLLLSTRLETFSSASGG